jgi:3',5'-cyclic AMP phosphodiesterase CpdA
MVESIVKAAKGTNKKKRLVVFSDTHITPHNAVFNSNIFHLGIEKINKIKDVTCYLHLGDLTHSGTLLDYEHALQQMSKFKPASEAPLYYTIGNHDSENVGYLLFEEIIGERHFEYEDDDLYIVGIDSTKPDLASGIIHQSTLRSVKNQFEKADRKDKIKIICFHHQTIPIPRTGKERSAIDDSGDTLKMLLDAHVDLVINGHRHISNLYNIGSPEKDLFIFNSGTFSCNKTRYRELFTYNVIDIEGNKINFKIYPILESQYMKDIEREINYYNPRKVKANEEPFCKIFQISNTLISDEKSKDNLNIDRTIDYINKKQNIDLVVHTGNLTKNGYKSEFKIAKEKLEKLKYPYIVVAGQTDSNPPAWDYWEEYIGPLDPSYNSDKLFFHGINSCTKDSTVGHIGRKRLRLLIEKVLRLSKKKICGFACFHSLIPAPLSIWRTELSDSGDVLSQLALSQIDVILNSTPSIPFNLKVENSLISNGGNLRRNYFDEELIEIIIYKDGLIKIFEHKLMENAINLIGTYHVNIFS